MAQPWQNRLLPNITLISPPATGGKSQTFIAKWVGNSRTGQRKVGLFDYPDVDRTRVQDLKSTSNKYPLTIHFDGPNYDLQADSFFKACATESGIWTITHPVYGQLLLQLLSFSESNLPVAAGGISVFELEFIEPLILTDELELKGFETTQSTAQIIQSRIDVIENFTQQLSDASLTLNTKVKTASRLITSSLDAVLRPIAVIDSNISTTYASVINGINSILQTTSPNKASLGGTFYVLTDFFKRVTGSSIDKLVLIDTSIKAVAVLDNNSSDITKGDLLIKELVLSSLLSAMVATGVETDAISRPKIINEIEMISNSFRFIYENLDVSSLRNTNTKIEEGYIPLENIFDSLYLNVGLAIQSMLANTLSLAIEKRFTLSEPKSPIQIVMEEYRDENMLDLFYETNNIKDSEFMLLPAGKQILIYIDRD